MAIADFSDRWRIFFIGTILSIWIFIIDGLNYALNWSEDVDNKEWAKVIVLITGFSFCLPTLIGCFMLLVWAEPKTGALIVVFTCFICGTLRLIATILGFQDFWQETYLDSTTAGTTDVAIAGLQLYLLFDAFNLYRFCNKQQKGYAVIANQDDDNVEIEIDEGTTLTASNPFDNDQTMSAYD